MPDSRIQVGVIGRAHGVRGLVKVTSHTADPADLTAYGPLSDAAGQMYVLCWKGDGVAEVSRIIDGAAVRVTDRTQAEKLTNTRLFIDRSALPPVDDEEYYLADLIGLAAVDLDGKAMGTVSTVHDYGAGASFEITGCGPPLLVPFTAACVPTVDLAAGRLVVAMPQEIVAAPDAQSLTTAPLAQSDDVAPSAQTNVPIAPARNAQSARAANQAAAPSQPAPDSEQAA
jgi:16S rRNA processing protein RimM